MASNPSGRTGPASSHQVPAAGPPVKYFCKLSIAVTVFYLAVLVIPWVLICIINDHFWQGYRYDDHTGSIRQSTFDTNATVWQAADVLNQIAVLITIPVIGFLVSRAVVVYTQRRSASQTTTLVQTIALADRQWTNPFVFVVNSMHKSNSLPLLLAAVLVAVVAVMQLLQRALIRPESILVVTCDDAAEYVSPGPDEAARTSGECPFSGRHIQVVATDRTVGAFCQFATSYPSDLIPLYHKFVAARPSDTRPNVWTAENFFTDGRTETIAQQTWLASVPADTNTGAIAGQQAMRFNSSITCAISQDPFPSPCPGAVPFTWSYSGVNSVGTGDQNYDRPYNASLCVPGNWQETPWLTTRNRQDVSEELFVQFEGAFGAENVIPSTLAEKNSTMMHCTAKTTLGYFELPSYSTNYFPGPLINLQPGSTDQDGNSSARCQNLEQASTPNDGIYPFPGPLTTSILALFGNQSWIHAAARDAFNFTPIYPGYNSDISALVADSYPLQPFWNPQGPDGPPFEGASGDRINTFLDLFFLSPNIAEANLNVAMDLHNEYLLLSPYYQENTFKAATEPSGPGTTVTSSGTPYIKPSISMGGIIAVSVLMGIEVACIIALVLIGISTPTWTRTLDAFAMLRIGADLQRQGVPIPSVGLATTEQKDTVADATGIVGAVPGSGGTAPNSSPLGVGATGVISRRTRHVVRDQERATGPQPGGLQRDDSGSGQSLGAKSEETQIPPAHV